MDYEGKHYRVSRYKMNPDGDDPEDDSFIILNHIKWFYPDDPIHSDITIYAVWEERIDQIEISITAPKCGTESFTPGGDGFWIWTDQENPPVVSVPENAYYELDGDYDFTIPAFWTADKKGKKPYVGILEGGEKYLALVYITPTGSYYFSNNIKVLVTGGTFVSCDFEEENYVILETEAVHRWGKWSEIKVPTEDAPGLKERICKGDPSHKETREIPKKESESGSEVPSEESQPASEPSSENDSQTTPSSSEITVENPNQKADGTPGTAIKPDNTDNKKDTKKDIAKENTGKEESKEKNSEIKESEIQNSEIPDSEINNSEEKESEITDFDNNNSEAAVPDENEPKIKNNGKTAVIPVVIISVAALSLIGFLVIRKIRNKTK